MLSLISLIDRSGVEDIMVFTITVNDAINRVFRCAKYPKTVNLETKRLNGFYYFLQSVSFNRTDAILELG